MSERLHEIGAMLYGIPNMAFEIIEIAGIEQAASGAGYEFGCCRRIRPIPIFRLLYEPSSSRAAQFPIPIDPAAQPAQHGRRFRPVFARLCTSFGRNSFAQKIGD